MKPHLPDNPEPELIPPPQRCGVYRLILGERAYVGASQRLNTRWQQHLRALALGHHHSRSLQEAYHRLGRAGLRFEVLEECAPAELGAAEEAWIARHPDGYNHERTSRLKPGGRLTVQWRGMAEPGVAPALAPQLSPRPNQRAADRALRRALRAGERGGLVQMPCGTGKTKFAAYVARHFRRVLFMTHTDELISQSVEAFREVWPGHDVGVVKRQEFRVDSRFTVASFQTLHRRLPYIAPDQFDLIVMDEGHLTGTAAAVRTLAHFRPRFLLALTATPERRRGVPLADLYERTLYTLGVPEAVAQGLIVPLRAVNVRLHLASPGGGGEDYGKERVARVMNTPGVNALIARETRAHAGDRPTLVYADTLAHAAALLTHFGPGAEAVWGGDPDREGKIARFQAGETQFLISVRVIGYGFDAPHASCAVLAFMTRSPVRFVQTVGRVMRRHPGKEGALLLDFGGNLDRGLRLDHEWAFEVDHLDPAQASRNLPEPRTISAREEPWEGEVTGVTLEDVDALRRPPRAPTYTFRPSPATAAQRALLTRLGYQIPQRLSKGHAHALLHAHPATPAQLGALAALGFPVKSYAWGLLEASGVLAAEGGGRGHHA